MNEQLGQLLQMKGSEQEARIQQLLKDEDFQRQAFFNLYLQQVQQAQLRHVVRCYGTSIIILYWESVINEAEIKLTEQPTETSYILRTFMN